MLENVIDSMNSLFQISVAGGGNQTAVPIVLLFAVVGGFILTHFTGSVGNLTVPANCAALYLGGTLSTRFGRGLDLPVDHDLMQPMLLAIAGMWVAATLMMIFMRHEGSSA